MRKIILDVDTGTDDAVAIMMAGLHPELRLVACTTVNGNVPVANCTDNTLRTLDLIGRADVPVYEGLSQPIARVDFPVPRAIKKDVQVHMAELPFPAARSKKQAMSAPEFLVKAYAGEHRDAVLVRVGIGAAVRHDDAGAGMKALQERDHRHQRGRPVARWDQQTGHRVLSSETQVSTRRAAKC